MSENIKDTINSLSIGDTIQVNDWEITMTVCGLSEHYALAHNGVEYTIIQKFPNERRYNGIDIGAFVCGPDNCVFGATIPGFELGKYQFDNAEWCEEYLNKIESGENEISMRNRAEITYLKKING